MKLTAQQVYDRLRNDDNLLDIHGQINFQLGEIAIIVKQKDVVGNIMQEWLEGWMIQNGIEYAPSENTQMPPDFYLNPDDLTKDLLEVKAFNYDATPGFDIADFKSFQNEIIEQPWMLHTDYLIFGYHMGEDGIVRIKNVWLKKVWEICRPMDEYPLNLQVKNKVINKIRPAKWYATGNRSKFRIFESLEDFVSAIEETVFKDPNTRAYGGTWLKRFKDAYKKKYDVVLEIPRWTDIEDKYILKKK